MATAFDIEMRDTALELIDEFGRTVILRQRRAEEAADPSKPWRGSEVESADTSVRCVILPLTRQAFNDGDRYANGDVIRADDQRAYIAPGSFSGLAPGDVIVDGEARWMVMQVREYRPGEATLLWELWVRR